MGSEMDMQPPPTGDSSERRARQRFLAQRRGEPCFWVVVDGHRQALIDISLEGFSMPAMDGASHEGFDFVLQRADVPDQVAGRAVVVNPAGSQVGAPGRTLGCRFVDLPAEVLARLEDWLITHVIVSATVRITEKDATAIVLGRSLV
ncbi:hypothetical protein CJ010_02475 [Azoarcus sp. DD4]|nr:hypothetical protein CJ010_02475 [Azoarcus sp. DD4]